MADWKSDYTELVLKIGDALSEKQGALLQQAQIMKAQHAPKRLFTYRRFDVTGHGLSNLLQSQFYLVPADSFNDPYDCHMRIDFMPIAKTYKSPDLSGTEFFSKLEELFGKAAGEQLLQALTDIGDDQMAQHSKKLQQGIKVACFSAKDVEQSFLMWSHYADQHRGFCAAYDPGEIGIPLLQPVLYSKTFFDATPYLQKAMEGQLNVLLPFVGAMYKHPDWSYEDEWRIVIPQGGQGGLPIQAPKPSFLLAGTRISAANFDQLKDCATQLQVPLFRSLVDTKKYLLTRHQVT